MDGAGLSVETRHNLNKAHGLQMVLLTKISQKKIRHSHGIRLALFRANSIFVRADFAI